MLSAAHGTPDGVRSFDAFVAINMELLTEFVRRVRCYKHGTPDVVRSFDAFVAKNMEPLTEFIALPRLECPIFSLTTTWLHNQPSPRTHLTFDFLCRSRSARYPILLTACESRMRRISGSLVNSSYSAARSCQELVMFLISSPGTEAWI
jgi:hypothetical protein